MKMKEVVAALVGLSTDQVTRIVDAVNATREAEQALAEVEPAKKRRGRKPGRKPGVKPAPEKAAPKVAKPKAAAPKPEPKKKNAFIEGS